MAKAIKQAFTPEQSEAMATIFENLLNKKLDALLPEPAEDTVKSDCRVLEDGTVEYTDPVVEVCDTVTSKALNSLPMGTKIVKTRGGTMIINQSQETLETIENFKKSRRLGRTRTFQR